jgi:hypothetical protein
MNTLPAVRVAQMWLNLVSNPFDVRQNSSTTTDYLIFSVG